MTAARTLAVRSPIAGWCCALDEVPDAVFSGRVLGDGLAIDPTEAVLLAPFDGEIVTLPASAHAVSIRSPAGIELLLHVGIDTVQLNGRGFSALVQPGAQVRSGDALLRIDLDAVAREAKSLITPIVVTAPEAVRLSARRAAGRVASGEVLFEVESRRSASPPAAEASGGEAERRPVRIALAQGLHARPAALLAQRAKASPAEITLHAHGRSAGARSAVAIMALGVRCGDELIIEARGTGATAGIDGLLAGLLEAQRLESSAAHGTARVSEQASPALPRASQPLAGDAIQGIGAAAGFAIGRAVRIERQEIAVAEAGEDAAEEAARLEMARSSVRGRLQRLAQGSDATRSGIVAAHLEFLDDPGLNAATAELVAQGKSAGFAWRHAIREAVAKLRALDDARLRERADDLIDLESQLLLALEGGAKSPRVDPLPEQAVVLAEDLLPTEFSALDRDRLVALCLGAGGATSHVAILAAALEIPMLVGLGAGIRAVTEGATVIVDADAGTLEAEPSAARIEAARTRLAAQRGRRAATRALAQGDCHALDGTRIEVFANLGQVADATLAVTNGAEGCGLLRTEFLFLDRDLAPEEAEQLAAYQAIVDALQGRPVILRLMDVGGDKPLHYLPLPPEPNPALGLRGVRTALARPDLLRTQLRAALRVQPAGSVQLLLPMITELAEIDSVRSLVRALADELTVPAPRIGIMIETPAAALSSARLIDAVDFLSIGTNDLTQYTLAMDRGHPQLAARASALQPAVLKLIAMACEAGSAAHKLVAVCGGAAADPLAVPLLLGLGVRELSVVPAAVPAIKLQVARLGLDPCAALARECLGLSSADEVRVRVSASLAQWGVAP